MPQQPVSSCYLYVFVEDSKCWLEMKTDPLVSPRLREAMNLILQEDGMIAFIGTRSEFGLYLTELERYQGTGSLDCWISSPASTILSNLGLCLNTEIPERPVLAFVGSPVVERFVAILEAVDRGLITRDLFQELFVDYGTRFFFNAEIEKLLNLNTNVPQTALSKKAE